MHWHGREKKCRDLRWSSWDGGAEPAQADMCGQFLTDLNKLLEEDEKEDITHE